MTIANLVRPNIPKPVKREQIVVTTAQPHHAPQIYRLGEYDDEDHPEECFTVAQLRNHIRRFPEGQFVALLGDQVLAFALTMRLHREPDAEPLRWLDAIGGLNIKNHQPTGEWLYGIDFLVSPKFRRRGIGTRMYNARFDLVKRLNLRGFYAGGMLMGYAKYRHTMTARAYGEAVMRGEIKDPTVTMQINRGFRPGGVIDNYTTFPDGDGSAMLIVWDNKAYRPGRRLRSVGR